MVDLLCELFVRPLVHCLHAVFVLQFPPRGRTFGWLKLAVAVNLLVVVGTALATVLLLWLGAGWFAPLATFAAGWIASLVLGWLAGFVERAARHFPPGSQSP
ncbi:MAG: hypothetical protein MUF06_14375 [Pirellulaceae bacterium]|jgi:hypothetical protein|nr:hypothetical protein [Pirellulaceae bacterium]